MSCEDAFDLLRLKDALPKTTSKKTFPESVAYSETTRIMNGKIGRGDCPPLNSNKAVRDFARNEYVLAGKSPEYIESRMQHRDAGHIKSLKEGGENTRENYLWEDSHSNRAHGSRPVSSGALQRAGRVRACG